MGSNISSAIAPLNPMKKCLPRTRFLKMGRHDLSMNIQLNGDVDLLLVVTCGTKKLRQQNSEVMVYFKASRRG